MEDFNPKKQFQSDITRREKWALMAADPTLHTAQTYALAVMSSRGLSPEQLLGANGFIFILNNLSEEPQKIKDLPRRQLTSFDKPTVSGNSPSQ